MNHIAAKSIMLATLLLVSSNLTQAQSANPPTAQYQMDIGTVTGLGGMTGGLGSAMSMMFGGKNKPNHMLELRLGSRLAPTGGAPSAITSPMPDRSLANPCPC